MDSYQDHFMGKSGFTWWMGINENRNDPLNTGRSQVRVFGWNTASKSLQPTEQLIWAHPVIPINTSEAAVKPPREGSMIFGFYLDGEAAQHPMMLGVVPGIPDQTSDPSHGFSDPRTDQQLKAAPRPPQKVEYRTDGKGAAITEAPNAHRYPNVLNEPTTSRIARNEQIQDTIIARKNNSLVSSVPVGTGGIAIDAGIDINAVFDAQAFLAAVLPPEIVSVLNEISNIEICGVSINALLPSVVLVGGINIQQPLFIDGQILMAGLELATLLSQGITLDGLLSLGIDINGCIIGGSIGGALHLDGLIKIPLLAAGASAGFGIPGLSIGASVHGGLKMGTLGGIPVTSSASWSEPPSPYKALYPYNHVQESESGHVHEIDDTPGHERLHRFHRAGTFEEIGPDGSRVTKVVKNDNHITMSDHNVNVMGDHSVTVNHKSNELVQGDKNKTVDKDHTTIVKGNDIETILGTQTKTISKTRTITLLENENMQVKGIVSHGIEKDLNIAVSGDRKVLVKGADTVAVIGVRTLMVEGDCNIHVGGNLFAEILGNSTTTVQGNASLAIQGNSTTTVQGNASTTVQGNMDTYVLGNINVTAAGPQTYNTPSFTINAIDINLNGVHINSTVSGSASWNVLGAFDVQAASINLN